MSKQPYYYLYGMDRSFYSQKMMAYLNYKDIPWRLNRTGGINPEATAVGWPGGVPSLKDPDGEYMWDSSAMIEHLELKHSNPSILPDDTVQRFLCYVLEDMADEWLCRLCVGSRWYYPENYEVCSPVMARELVFDFPPTITVDQVKGLITANLRSSSAPFGLTEDNVQVWMDEILKPWIKVLGAHLDNRPYLFGERPSLADCGIFGGNAAHFYTDVLCRRWLEEGGRSIVGHTHRLTEPWRQSFGDWDGDIPDTLIDLLADLGNYYLPYVSEACKNGSAVLAFKNGQSVEIKAKDFLKNARGVLLARYKELRSDALDNVLDRAGILKYFADYVDQAGVIPDDTDPPRPVDNVGFPGTLGQKLVKTMKLFMDLGINPNDLIEKTNPVQSLVISISIKIAEAARMMEKAGRFFRSWFKK